jgi:hypothetical protein
MHDLSEYIVTEVLNQDNCTAFYADAIKFEDKKLQAKCETVMVRKFSEIADEQTKYFLDLPLKNFVNICKSNSLNVMHENQLVQLIKQYVKYREDIEEKEKDLPIWDKSPKVWDIFTK